ncbi:MAG: GntR family transcriptional regulator [Proteobacteria bacterium]|nr:GntR family transcriptional regulator [Pseudomonadota bacterium]
MDKFAPLIPRAAAPLRQQVLDTMRQSIVDGRLAPGARLIERELISMLGVSRTVIREVMRQLESQGLIVVLPNKGAIVRELSLADANDLYSIRAVLEGLAAGLFAKNATDADIEKLEEALGLTIKAYRAGDPKIILEAKNQFYEVLFRGAASESLWSMLVALHARIWQWRAIGLAHPQRAKKRTEEAITSLRVLVSSIKKRNASQAESVARTAVSQAAAEIARLLSANIKSR